MFVAVASTVKQALQDSLVQILQPKRRVDILRDVMEAQSQRRPFVITFCGVNGVGKSTNLAKVMKLQEIILYSKHRIEISSKLQYNFYNFFLGFFILLWSSCGT